MFSYVAIVCILGTVSAAPYQPHASYGLSHVDTVSMPRYEFNYAVNDPHTGDNKAQSEVRDGGYVKGSYSVAEPDGTLRVVDYTADPHSGFNAVVKRLGPAAHPQTVYAKAVAAPALAPVAVPEPIVAPIAPAYSSSLVSLGHGYDFGSGLDLGGYWGHLGHGDLGFGHGDLGLGHGHGWH